MKKPQMLAYLPKITHRSINKLQHKLQNILNGIQKCDILKLIVCIYN